MDIAARRPQDSPPPGQMTNACPSSRARRAGIIAVVALVLSPASALAQSEELTPRAATIAPPPGVDHLGGPPLEWKWARFSGLDYAVTLVSGATMLTAALVPPRSQHSLSGGIWFDDAVRDAIGQDDIQTRYIFRDASDVGLSLAVTWPFFADSLVTAWWYRGSRDVAEQTALINLQTLAIAGAVQGVTNVLVSRERPYGRNCGTEALPDDTLDCEGSIHYRSFFSGHSSHAFTGAALICVHHAKLGLLGAPWDALSCAGGYAVAATTATFRVVSDVHYASDVLTGALVGTLIGYGVPLLHYGASAEGERQRGGVEVQLVPIGSGLGLLGVF